MLTRPSIHEAQNNDDATRLVAAQARMYSDAKRLFFGRQIAVAILAVAAIATSAIWVNSKLVVGGGGGLALFAASLVVESIEKRKRNQAAATQELFDTRIYQIPWNSLGLPRPSSAAVAQAASRYRAGRERDWYDDTKRTERPFDILICQATNLGWGASMHRIWAGLLTTMLVLVSLGVASFWIARGLTFQDALLSLLLPLLAPAKEAIALLKGNLESAADKEKVERSINDLWDRGMTDKSWTPSLVEIRSVQDRVVALRQVNSYVPDWLDKLFRKRNEAAMRQSVADKVAQASREGRTG